MRAAENVFADQARLLKKEEEFYMLEPANKYMYVFLFNVLGTNWGANKQSSVHANSVILVLREKQFLLTSPHALDSVLDKKPAVG